jgi:hypothetical protein
MASSFTSEGINDRLDKLQVNEENVASQIEEINKLLKKASTTEETSRIINSLDRLNDNIISIRKERLQLLDIIKTQMEKGRSLIYFVSFFSSDLFFSKRNCWFTKQENTKKFTTTN